ncbi:zf-RVT domain-containing protein [Abeliophyllum distichum]|uniref:Zf-RVT domain-containing protein n=1 Tax=Abeliophyllum distichum TaxID=126358 RepID=A0ABD1TWB0_9LAMI
MDIAPLFDVIITTPSPPPPTLVFWRTPPVGSYKINTDGCVKDGVASGGGIIRDSSGQCIRAFFSFYGDCTILEAGATSYTRRDHSGSETWVISSMCGVRLYINDPLHHQGRRTLAYSGYSTVHQASTSAGQGYYLSHLPRGTTRLLIFLHQRAGIDATIMSTALRIFHDDIAV